MSQRKPDLEQQLCTDLEHLRLAVFFDGPGHYQVESTEGHKFYIVHVDRGPMPPVTTYISTKDPKVGAHDIWERAREVLRLANEARPQDNAPHGYLPGGPLPRGTYIARRIDNYIELLAALRLQWPDLKGWPDSE